MGNSFLNFASIQRLALLMGVIILLVLSPALTHAQTGFEAMDQKGLTNQVDLLKARLDKNPSDYEALRSLGTAGVRLQDPVRALQRGRGRGKGAEIPGNG